MYGVILDAESMGDDIELDRVKEQFDRVDVWPSTSEEECLSRIKDAEVIVVNKVKLSDSHFALAESLKLIAVMATGTNNIDLAAAEKLGIKVCNVTQYGAPTIVQHTFSLILALANHLIDYIDDVKAGKWQTSQQFCLMGYPIVELEGKTIGIIGYGDLGRNVAKMAEAFGMKVVLGARPGQSVTPIDGYDRIPLSELLPQADVVSLHCLLSDETTNLIGANELAMMKPTAFLINVARGGLINESSLAEALKSGSIAGAATDVLTQEPPKEGNVLLDPTIPNLIVTPHCAWASREARQRLADKTAENIRRFIHEVPQLYIV